ncbi:hypothetical protein ACHHYP_08095 [Achlya hypogyna]|uniref:Cyclic nucleotide-binding domain-containing protein n=1 Tax=Achlya hypogyna TaxID=1202772 RepID=A0A1V9YPU5_ACHHY|nr:hypothetical protein ACHHYP_08095 [Achlya hypogyna]
MRRRPVPPDTTPLGRGASRTGPNIAADGPRPASYFMKLLFLPTRPRKQNEELAAWLADAHPLVHTTLAAWALRGGMAVPDLLAIATLRTYGTSAVVVTQDATPTGTIFVVVTGTFTEFVRPHQFGLPSKKRRPAAARAWRTLGEGEGFGLDTLYYRFPHHYVTVVSNGTAERSAIGLSTTLPALVLSLGPHALLASLVPPVPPLPYEADVLALLQTTFLFAALPRAALEFVAGHVPPAQVVPKGEYLFTAGQPTGIYLVATGELRVFTVDDVVVIADDRQVATRRVELQILRPRDVAGLTESCFGEDAAFTTYCVATTPASVLMLPANVVFSVLTPSTAAFPRVCAYFRLQRDWYKLRRFTALNRFNHETDHKLTGAMQRKSGLCCARCGEPGHLSDAAACPLHVDSTEGPRTLDVLRQRDAVRSQRLAQLECDVPRQPSLVSEASRMEKLLALRGPAAAKHRRQAHKQ